MVRPKCALITDFDGTMTKTDFYELVVDQCLDADVADYWTLYSSGTITHFEAMAGIFRHIVCPEEKVLEMLKLMDADPAIPEAAIRLRDCGWDVTVVSNGCAWYIHRIFASLKVAFPLHSNPGRFVAGQGLVLELPEDSPFFSKETGISKVAVVQDAMQRFERVAFAGNGPPDLEPALMVPPDLRFARGWLAGQLSRQGEGFRRFDRWSEIASMLCGEGVN